MAKKYRNKQNSINTVNFDKKDISHIDDIKIEELQTRGTNSKKSNAVKRSRTNPRRRGKKENFDPSYVPHKKEKDKKISKKQKQENYRNGYRKNGKSKRWAKRKKIKVISSAILLVLFLIGLLFAFLYYTQIVIPTNISNNKPLSILVVGTDESSYRSELWKEGDKATLTDSLMVLTYNPNYNKFEVTSIPRDTSVDYVCDSLPDYQDQINEAYYLSKNDMNCLESVVSNFLNVPIDYYAKIDFDQFSKIIDTLGGIEIKAHAADGTLTQANEVATQTYSWTDGETYKMSGDEALSYSRARHDSEKDYGRGLRQQQVVSALINEAMTSDLSMELATQILQSVETDLPAKIAYDYSQFLKGTADIKNQLIGDKEIDASIMRDSAWIHMFDFFKYDFKGSNVSDSDVNAFKEYLNKNYKEDDIKTYFFTQHQFFNEAYDGHYNVVEEQLQTISDALRINLGLKTETVKVPSKEYGDNEASGLIPTEWATGSGSSSGSMTTTTTPKTTTTEKPKVENTDKDTDGDGILDSKDSCPNESGNGTSNGCPSKDSDGDGFVDKDDSCPNESATSAQGSTDGCPVADDTDTDQDGFLDTADACPNESATSAQGSTDGCLASIPTEN